MIGTNTYLVGKRAPYILVDTGDGRPEYLKYFRDVFSTHIKPPNAGLPIISDIIITHKHRDHQGGLPSVLSLLRELEESRNDAIPGEYIGPKLHKFPLPPNEQPDDHFRTTIDSLSEEIFVRPSEDMRLLNETPFHPLKDKETIHGQGVKLQVLHTPGHTTDSICLYLPEDDALFTADSILGHGTAVFENLSTYIESLRVLLSFDYQPPGLQVLYPGHGPVIDTGAKDMIGKYISHRLEREQQILQVLGTRSQNWWAVEEILGTIYPEKVHNMAKRGVLLHLNKLELDGKVAARQYKDAQQWKVISTN